MKKLFVGVIMLLTAAILIACSGSNGSGWSTDDISDGNTDSISADNNTKKNKHGATGPNTFMDMFDGERRVWFYLRNLAYDSPVVAVFITENKKMTAFYYNIIFGDDEIISQSDAIVPRNERYQLSDFVGLTDDEIIKMVSGSYCDASLEYKFTVGEKERYFHWWKCEFPYEIRYKGKLDASGNNLEEEDIELFSAGGMYDSIFRGFNTMEDKYYYDKNWGAGIGVASEEVRSTLWECTIVEPTIIKDKEYVGIKAPSVKNGSNIIITQNSYGAFGNIRYDSAKNITDEKNWILPE